MTEVGRHDVGRRNMDVRDLGLRWPLDASLQYPQDSLL
jgi:hypothetical protein